MFGDFGFGCTDNSYKIVRDLSWLFASDDFGAVYLQSLTSHQGYKKLMVGENCLKAASCEPGFLYRHNTSLKVIIP